ncbi:hypothetical protein AB0A05_35285 [Streptomyces sp. NPDC046374]|uniref:hypothetical protein n=1 Tax=Streptomyces sp. NPDC046374 TaxID=3154917 RepID=UPI0033F1679A
MTGAPLRPDGGCSAEQLGVHDAAGHRHIADIRPTAAVTPLDHWQADDRRPAVANLELTDRYADARDNLEAITAAPQGLASVVTWLSEVT